MTSGFRGILATACTGHPGLSQGPRGRAGGWHAQKGVPIAVAERGIGLCCRFVALLPRAATACPGGLCFDSAPLRRQGCPALVCGRVVKLSWQHAHFYVLCQHVK